MLRTLTGAAAALIGAMFLILGLAFLLNPTAAAARFEILAAGVAGYATFRSDLAGLLLGMGIFTLVGVAARRWLVVPLGFLGVIIAGRMVSLLGDGPSGASLRTLVVELIAVLLLAAAWSVGEEPARGWKTLAFTAIAALILAAGCAFLFERQIGMALYKRQIESAMAQPMIATLPEGLHAGLCGSGSPLPDPNRAGPCVFVAAGKRLYVVDTGEDSPRKLALMGIPPGALDAIFLTHFHSDHIGGLGEMMLQRWAGAGHDAPLEVFGPQGVERVVDGFNNAYRLDAGYRVVHHGAATLPPSGAGGVAHAFTIPETGEARVVVLERDGLRVTAFTVQHAPVFPAVGYRFDYRGRSVVISGDTAPSESLVANARNADVLFHEGLQAAMVAALEGAAARNGRRVSAKILADIPSYHTTPEDAARMAERTGVRLLVIYHIIPPLPLAYFDGAFLGDAAKSTHPPVTLGKDGMMFSLAPESTAISMRELL